VWEEPIPAQVEGIELDDATMADLLHAVYDRVTVAGRRIVSVRLTPSAYAHGFALALPERLQWRARQDLTARTPQVSGSRSRAVDPEAVAPWTVESAAPQLLRPTRSPGR
jgi:hypothetical protein